MGKVAYHHGDLKMTILDAAEEVLSEKSLDAMSMRELARKAGVSPGAPYHHFGDRAGLISGLCQRGFARLGEALSKGQESDQIKGMIDEYLKFSNDNHALYQLMYSAEATEGDFTEALNPYARPIFTLLENAIEKAVKPKPEKIRDLSPASVWCFMHGVATLSMASPLQARLGDKELNEFAYNTIKKIIS